MKKSIFLMAVAALAMTSCAKEETLESNPGEAIDFRVAMGTRADAEEGNTIFYENTTKLPECIYVTAIREETTESGTNTSVYFSNIKFTKNDADGSYNSDPNYYWPTKGKLTFYAYAPDKDDLGGDATINTSTKTLGMAAHNVIGKQEDLIVAVAEGTKENHNDAKSLVFKHTLAQIGVQAKVDENTTLKYTITGVKIVGFKGAGTFTFPDAVTSGDAQLVWALNGDATPYKTPDTYAQQEVKQKGETDATDPITLLLDGETTVGNALVIPQTVAKWTKIEGSNNMHSPADGAYIAVRLGAVHKADGTTEVIPAGTWAATPIPTTVFEPGKKYIYTLNFAKGAGWKEPGGNDPTTDDGQPVLDENSLIEFVSVSVTDWDVVFKDDKEHDGDVDMDPTPTASL